MSDQIGVPVLNSVDIYSAESDASLAAALQTLELDLDEVMRSF
jgi:hypothetical protein